MKQIRSIHIDFDQNILEINGEPVKKPTVVCLPTDFNGKSFENGWPIRKLFNSAEAQDFNTYDRIDVAVRTAEALNNTP